MGIEELKQAQRDLARLSAKAKTTLSGHMGVRDFTGEEQELIRRVFKSVFKSINNHKDRLLAKEILEKTEWIEDLYGKGEDQKTEQ